MKHLARLRGRGGTSPRRALATASTASPRRRSDALHDLRHSLPLLPDGGLPRESCGNLPLVLHEEHEGLGEVLLQEGSVVRLVSKDPGGTK